MLGVIVFVVVIGVECCDVLGLVVNVGIVVRNVVVVRVVVWCREWWDLDVEFIL